MRAHWRDHNRLVFSAHYRDQNSLHIELRNLILLQVIQRTNFFQGITYFLSTKIIGTNCQWVQLAVHDQRFYRGLYHRLRAGDKSDTA